MLADPEPDDAVAKRPPVGQARANAAASTDLPTPPMPSRATVLPAEVITTGWDTSASTAAAELVHLLGAGRVARRQRVHAAEPGQGGTGALRMRISSASASAAGRPRPEIRAVQPGEFGGNREKSPRRRTGTTTLQACSANSHSTRT